MRSKPSHCRLEQIDPSTPFADPSHDPKTTEPQKFLGAQFDAGLAWVHFPDGYGGLGLSPKLQNVANQRLGAAGVPLAYARNPIGYGMCAPTVVTRLTRPRVPPVQGGIAGRRARDCAQRKIPVPLVLGSTMRLSGARRGRGRAQ